MLERIGPIAYKIALPTNTIDHEFFHVSLFKKYIHDHNHVIEWDVIQVEPEGEFQTEPLRILDKQVTVLQNRAVGQVKVQWKHYGLDEATWDLEDAIRVAHPFLFNFAEH